MQSTQERTSKELGGPGAASPGKKDKMQWIPLSDEQKASKEALDDQAFSHVEADGTQQLLDGQVYEQHREANENQNADDPQTKLDKAEGHEQYDGEIAHELRSFLAASDRPESGPQAHHHPTAHRSQARAQSPRIPLPRSHQQDVLPDHRALDQSSQILPESGGELSERLESSFDFGDVVYVEERNERNDENERSKVLATRRSSNFEGQQDEANQVVAGQNTDNVDFSNEVHALRIADSWDTREFADQASDPAPERPSFKDCTCQEGHKLDCPVHGLNAPNNRTLEWSIPESQPVGLPEATPRAWQQPYTSRAHHHIEWEPGQAGKWIKFRNGDLHMWPTDQYEAPHHDWMLDTLGRDDHVATGDVLPSGELASWGADPTTLEEVERLHPAFMMPYEEPEKVWHFARTSSWQCSHCGRTNNESAMLYCAYCRANRPFKEFRDPLKQLTPEHPDPWMDNEPTATVFPIQWTWMSKDNHVKDNPFPNLKSKWDIPKQTSQLESRFAHDANCPSHFQTTPCGKLGEEIDHIPIVASAPEFLPSNVDVVNDEKLSPTTLVAKTNVPFVESLDSLSWIWITSTEEDDKNEKPSVTTPKSMNDLFERDSPQDFESSARIATGWSGSLVDSTLTLPQEWTAQVSTQDDPHIVTQEDSSLHKAPGMDLGDWRLPEEGVERSDPPTYKHDDPQEARSLTFVDLLPDHAAAAQENNREGDDGNHDSDLVFHEGADYSYHESRDQHDHRNANEIPSSEWSYIRSKDVVGTKSHEYQQAADYESETDTEQHLISFDFEQDGIKTGDDQGYEADDQDTEGMRPNESGRSRKASNDQSAQTHNGDEGAYSYEYFSSGFHAHRVADIETEPEGYSPFEIKTMRSLEQNPNQYVPGTRGKIVVHPDGQVYQWTTEPTPPGTPGFLGGPHHYTVHDHFGMPDEALHADIYPNGVVEPHRGDHALTAYLPYPIKSFKDKPWDFTEEGPLGSNEINLGLHAQDDEGAIRPVPRVGAIQVEHVEPGGRELGTHDMDEDEWKANGGKPSAAQTKPFVYVPQHNKIYVGNPGWYHDDLEDGIFGIVRRGPTPPVMRGRIYPDGGVHAYDDLPYEEGRNDRTVMDNVVNALGGQGWNPNQWDFTAAAPVPFGLRTPFLYDPNSDQVYMGEQGAIHQEVYNHYGLPHTPLFSDETLMAHGEISHSFPQHAKWLWPPDDPKQAYQALNRVADEAGVPAKQVKNNEWDFTSATRSVREYTPRVYSSTATALPEIVEHDYADYQEPFGSHDERRPLIYHEPTNTLHVGPYDMTHSNLLTQMQSKGYRVTERDRYRPEQTSNPSDDDGFYTGHHGWLGPNHETFGPVDPDYPDDLSDIVHNHEEPSEYGWYARDPGPLVDLAIQKRWNIGKKGDDLWDFSAATKHSMEAEWRCEDCGKTVYDPPHSSEHVKNNDYLDPGTWAECEHCGGRLKYIDDHFSKVAAPEPTHDPDDPKWDSLYDAGWAGSHDYDPRWDYSDELRPEWHDHPLTQLAQQRLQQHVGENGRVFAADLSNKDWAAAFIHGTGGAPVIIFDPHAHELHTTHQGDAEYQTRRTIDHEYRHAQQEMEAGGEPDYDEDDAEGWAPIAKTAIQSATEPVLKEPTVKEPGQRAWFEYHCNQSHESPDAQAWYRSHQPVSVISREDFEDEAGPRHGYQVQFDDGHVHQAFDDELHDDPSEYGTQAWTAEGFAPPSDRQQRTAQRPKISVVDPHGMRTGRGVSLPADMPSLHGRENVLNEYQQEIVAESLAKGPKTLSHHQSEPSHTWEILSQSVERSAGDAFTPVHVIFKPDTTENGKAAEHTSVDDSHACIPEHISNNESEYQVFEDELSHSHSSLGYHTLGSVHAAQHAATSTASHESQAYMPSVMEGIPYPFEHKIGLRNPSWSFLDSDHTIADRGPMGSRLAGPLSDGTGHSLGWDTDYAELNAGVHPEDIQHGWGKGILDSRGNVHTWNTDAEDGSPTHSEYLESSGIGQNYAGPFEIHPSGEVETFSGRPHEWPEIYKADPRLYPKEGEDWDFSSHISGPINEDSPYTSPTRPVKVEHLLHHGTELQDSQEDFENVHEDSWPIVHDPQDNTVYIGRLNGYHGDMIDHITEGERPGYSYNPFKPGGYGTGRMKNKGVEWYERPRNAEEIHQALGVKEAPEGCLWNFTSAVGPPSIVEINKGNVSDHDDFGAENLSPYQSRPFIYHKPSHTIYVGEPGGYHDTLVEDHIPYERGVDSLQGRLNPDKTYEMWGSESGAPIAHQIGQALGATPLTGWDFTSAYGDLNAPRVEEVFQSPGHGKTHGEERVPIRYDPGEGVIYKGQPGAYHISLPGGIGVLDGGYWPEKNVAEMYMGYDHHAKEVENGMGVPTTRTQWHDDEAPKGWDFTSARTPLNVVERTPEPRGNNPIIYHKPSQTIYMAENGGAHENLIEDYNLPYTTDHEEVWHGRLWTAQNPGERTAIEWYGAEPPEAKEIHSFLGAEPPYEGEDRWNFSSVSDPVVEEFEGLNVPSWSPHGNIRRPFIYYPKLNLIHLGSPGSHHGDIEPPPESWGAAKVYGGLWPGRAETYSYGGISADMIDHAALQRALGVPEYSFGDYHNNPEPQNQSWDFSSAVTATQVVPINHPGSRGHGEGEPVIHDPETDTVYVGPQGSYHWDMYPHMPNIDPEALEGHNKLLESPTEAFEGLSNGRIEGDHVDWYKWPHNFEEVNNALGVQPKTAWDFTASGLNVPPDPSICVDCGGAGCALCEYTGLNQIGPMQQTPEELPTHGPVQIGNEEPGVATIGA